METLTRYLTETPLLFDLILAAAVLVFAFLGARKGLILSLCSLFAVIIALVGGTAIANLLTPPLAARAAPAMQNLLSHYLEELTRSGTQALEHTEGFLPYIIRSVLGQQDWLIQADDFLSEFTFAVSKAILHPILFLIAFVLILLLWHLVSHALDLVARLPVLSTLNAVGGFVFGAIKGGLFLLLACLLFRTFLPDLLPEALLEESKIFSLLQKAPFFL